MKSVTTVCFAILIVLSVSAFGQVPTTGLIAYYPFNSNANDESGNGHTGTINGATLTADRWGNAVSAFKFNGNGNYIDIGEFGEINDLSISMWFRSDSSNQNSITFGSSTSNNTMVRLNLRFNDVSSRFYYLLSTQTGPDNELYGYVESIPNDKNWHHFVFTRSGNSTAFFLDGQQRSITAVHAANIQSVNTHKNYFLGADNGDDPSSSQRYYFNGCLDDIRIYSRTLTINEMEVLYQEEAKEMPNSAIVYGIYRNSTCELWRLDPVTSAQSRIITLGGNSFTGPSLSPDGSKIAFGSNLLGYDEIFVVNMDGTELRRVATDGSTWPTGNYDPRWIDNEYLLYASSRVNVGQREIVRIKIDGTEEQVLTNLGGTHDSYMLSCPSPDKTRITFSKGVPYAAATTKVYVADYPSFNNQILVGDINGNSRADWYPVWSSNNLIAFYSDDTPGGKIYTVNPDGSQLKGISLVPSVGDCRPRFSPDGSKIAFLSNQSGTYNVWTMNVDGTDRRQLTFATGSDLISILDWGSAAGQRTFTLSGYVFEDIDGDNHPSSGEGINEASVFLVRADESDYKSTKSYKRPDDQSGYFQFRDIPKGTYRIYVSKTSSNGMPEYVTASRDLTLDDNTESEVQLFIALKRTKQSQVVTSGWFMENDIPQTVQDLLGLFTEINPFWYKLSDASVNSDRVVFVPNSLNPNYLQVRQTTENNRIQLVPTIHEEECTSCLDALLADNNLMNKFVSEVEREVIVRGYDGIDIDLEKFADDFSNRRGFRDLMNKLFERLIVSNKYLSVTVQDDFDGGCKFDSLYRLIASHNLGINLKVMLYERKGVMGQIQFDKSVKPSIFSSVKRILNFGIPAKRLSAAINTYGEIFDSLIPYKYANPKTCEPIFECQRPGNKELFPYLDGRNPNGTDDDYHYYYVADYQNFEGQSVYLRPEDRRSWACKINYISLSGVSGVSIWHLGDMIDPGFAQTLRDFVENPTNPCPWAWDLAIYLQCPADMEVVDPLGTVIKKGDYPSNASYMQIPAELEGDSTDLVVVYTPVDGRYLVHVIPTNEADKDDRFTLFFIREGRTDTIAFMSRMDSIPEAGYHFWTIPVGSISGTVSDSSWGLLGVTLDLFDSTGVLSQVRCTDSDGYFEFDSIGTGDYVISIVTPLGYIADFETRPITVTWNTDSIVNFKLHRQSSTPRPRSRAYWADQLSRALQNKPQDYALKDFSRFTGLISVHFNQNKINPIDFYSVPQPASQSDSLMILKKLLLMCTSEKDPFLKRLGKSDLIALMLNVVSGKISQTQAISADGRTVSQAITYCEMLVNDELDCPNTIPGHGIPGCRYVLADAILTLVNFGLKVPKDLIPANVIQIAYKIHNEENLPTEFTLQQNYPNPFNPKTQIDYALPKDCNVKVMIYNILGQKVMTLVDEFQTAGFKIVVWDGKDDKGQDCASGIYFYKIQAGEFSQAKKMVIIK